MPGKPVMTFAAAPAAGNYGEMPVLGSEIDPQLHLSRNDRPQPFFLVCQKDTVVVQMSGRGRLEFPTGPARYFTLEVGDFAYVPGGLPHRYLPDSASVQYRYKAREAGLEAVAWYCQSCGGEVARRAFDTAKVLPQDGYAEACAWFNGEPARRTCPGCGAAHAPADTTGTRWREIAAEVRSGRRDAAE
jgi:3-hydroxyanthranilate 3,4-dioxygenase